MAGVHEQVRDEIMGHASSDMGRRYSHVPRASLTEAIDRLPPRAPEAIGEIIPDALSAPRPALRRRGVR